MKIQSRKTAGFTLIELAIVLGIAGVLFGGVWKLVSASNAQMRDQAAAKQHAQIADAVGAFLRSDAGQSWLMGVPGVQPGNSVACELQVIMGANLNYVPDGEKATCAHLGKLKDAFERMGISGDTTSPYGQSYAVGIRRDDLGATEGTPANNYSFMVMTHGGDRMSDTSGGRVSSMIGADGGFVYNQDSCTPSGSGQYPRFACGAYGSWRAELSDYFIGALTSNPGHVASRTFVSSMQGANVPWLARLPHLGDKQWNTMFTSLYFGNQEVYFGKEVLDRNLINTMWVQGGTIDLGTKGGADGHGTNAKGKIFGNANHIEREDALIDLREGNFPIDSVGKMENALLKIRGRRCKTNVKSYTPQNMNDAAEGWEGGCTYTAEIDGDVTVRGMLYVHGLYARQYIYDNTGLPSDIKLKTDVAPITNALDALAKLKPVSYKLKSTSEDSMGFIAQDVEKVYPKLVSEMADGTKLLNYNGLIAPVVEAIQTLKKENEELKASITKLEAEIKAIKK